MSKCQHDLRTYARAYTARSLDDNTHVAEYTRRHSFVLGHLSPESLTLSRADPAEIAVYPRGASDRVGRDSN